MKAADLPLDYNAVDILEKNLATRADKVALQAGDDALTFSEVSEKVNRVGNALREVGFRKGETLAILCPDSAPWVVTFFATIKIGGIVASLNTLLTRDEYAYMLRDSDARVLAVHESLLPQVADLKDECPSLEHILVFGTPRGGGVPFADFVAGQSDRLEPVSTHREDFCCLNYSSGTTGEPKGILHAHKDLLLTAELVGKNTLGLREDDRTFAVAKLFFTFGTGGNLVFPWHVGASIVLFAGSPRKAPDVLSVIERYRPTVFYTAPTGYASMLAAEEFDQTDLGSLRLCVSAGEALPAPIWHEWRERTGLDTLDGIGSTENYHMFISNRPGDIRPGSSGRPVEGYEVKIVDSTGSEVERGEVGTLLVRGETAALSYLHQYERSKQSFRGDWLDTGDKYYVDEEGYYWHAGRSDDMLKVGGIWVSPVEVESTLVGHPEVVEAAVIGERDHSDLIKPVAFVTLREGADVEALPDELIDYCRTHMAAYKRPRRVVVVPSLPKTATGKIQRFRLREMPEVSALRAG